MTVQARGAHQRSNPLGDQGHPEKHPAIFPQHRGYGLPTVHLLSLPPPVVGASSVACISFQFRVTNYPQTPWLEHGSSWCLWLGNSGATAPGASGSGSLVGRHLSGQPELLCRPNAWRGWRTPCPGGSLTGLLAESLGPSSHTPMPSCLLAPQHGGRLPPEPEGKEEASVFCDLVLEVPRHAFHHMLCAGIRAETIYTGG